MKVRMMLLMFCILAITPAVFAQTSTIKLFDATRVTRSDSRFPSGPNGTFEFDDAISFGEASVFCPVGGTGTVSGPLTGGGFIVDNFLTVNGRNVCRDQAGSPTGEGNCFSSFDGSTAAGENIEQSFGAVAPITLNLSSGGVFTFSLMDFGGFFGNTAVNLTGTNCTLLQQDEEGKFAVCHRNNRNKNKNKNKNKGGEFKTIFVDAEDVDDHVNHGDTLGPCPGDSAS